MIKILGIWKMALIAVLMCIGFSSCGSDDNTGENSGDEGGSAVSGDKKLSQITFDDDMTWDFSYDAKGRLLSLVRSSIHNGKTSTDVYNITWDDNTIKEEGDHSITYTLTNGLISSYVDGDWNYSLAYNSQNQLTMCKGRKDDITKTKGFSWEGGIFSSYTIDDDNYKITFGSQSCKGFFPLVVSLAEDDPRVFWAHPELIGLKVKQLPIWEDSNGLTCEFNNKLDSEGYLESCTIKRRKGNNETTEHYSFKWE